MRFTDTDIKYCNECKGTYRVRLLEIGTNAITLCKECRDKLYKIVDEEDELVVYKRNN